MTASLGMTLAMTTRATAGACCPIVELRQYVMKPGGCDVLIDLFDRHFIDPQEAAGSTILGQFRNLDNPDRFVWLRGFADMAARPKALDAFYTSAIWKEHRDAANATMIDVGDVLLLKPLRPLALGHRPQDESAQGIVVIAIYSFDTTVAADTIAAVDRQIEAAGAHAIAAFVTEKSPNNYPRLPIRERENVLVRIRTFPSAAAHDKDRVEPTAALNRTPQILRLAPTARSLLHG